MTWLGFYLICFIVGFALTVFSLLAGLFHLHLPTKWQHIFHGTHGLGHIPHPPGGSAHAIPHALAHAAPDLSISPFNFSTVMAFLTWFGGAGYLLTLDTNAIVPFVLGSAIVSGLLGGSIVFWYLTKFLLKHDKSMDPSDFELVGVIGRLSVPIRAGGTGEIVYTQGGTRKSLGACSDDGTEMKKGEEVAVTRYERGIAYVRRWEDLALEAEAQQHRKS